MKKTLRSLGALVGLSLITSYQALGSGGTVQNEDPREELSARSDELLDALAVAQKPASSEKWTVENWEYGIFPAPCTNDRGDKYQLTARRSFEGESGQLVRHDLQTRIARELQEAGFTVDDALEAEFGNTVIAHSEHVKVTVVLRPSGRYEVDGEYMCALGPISH